MSNRTVNGYCNRHCKSDVYTKQTVDELLQEFESGELQTLPWYKGTSETIKYEYSGFNPAKVAMNTAPNLLSYIISDSLEKLEENTDMASIINCCKNGFFAKVYNNGYEYFATFDTSTNKLIVTKNNYYVKQIDEAGDVSIQYLIYKGRDGDFKIHYEEVLTSNTTSAGSNIIQIQSDFIEANTFIELFPLDENTREYMHEYYKSAVYFMPGLALINLKAGTIGNNNNLNFGVKVTPCQCNTNNTAKVMLCMEHYANV